MIFTWLKVRKLKKEIRLLTECVHEISKILHCDDRQLDRLEREVKMFRAFLSHVEMSINESKDGSITFESKYKFTKVGHNGAVERWN